MLQTCFFAISGVLPRDEAIDRIKAAIAKTYGRRGAEVVERNQAAVDRALEGLHRVEVPEQATVTRELPPAVPAHAPEFVRAVTAAMMAGRGDQLPVSALPVDGTYPSGTAAYEKRNISELVAVWDPDLCIQCGNCSFVCPHSVIRSTHYDEAASTARRTGSVGAAQRGRPAGHPVHARRSTSRTAPAASSASRPARSRRPATRSARRSTSPTREPLVDGERESIAFFEQLPADRPRAGRLRHGARHAVPGAAVRVLRRVRRLRRDAVPEARSRSSSATG